MKRLSSIFFFCCSVQLAAQKLYVYPATAIAPRGSYQTVTAIVTGANNKTVTWSTNHGTLVGTNPCVVNEPCTVAVYDTTAETATLTATSNANGSVVATSTITFTASPTPVSTWPRFLITAANQSALQAKATGANTMYQAIRAEAIGWYNTDNTSSAWGTGGATGFVCQGGNGQPATSQVSNNPELGAYVFAYMALIDPSDRTYNWACYAHDVGVYVWAQYPTYFSAYNYNFKDLGGYMIYSDWLRGAVTLTSGELATYRTFASWLAIVGFQGGGGAPNPANAYNSPGMFQGYVYSSSTFPAGPQDLANFRGFSGNNYSIARMLILSYAGLDFNDNMTDAPNISTGTYNTCGATRYQVCPDGTAGSLIAYWKYLDGAVLYNYWAHVEDPNVSWQAYQTAYGNLPTVPSCESTDLAMHPCFGDGRDGGSSEGEWYQYSMYLGRWMLNILHTTGVDDPIVNGPQMSVSTSSWWDLKLVHDLEAITGNNVDSGTPKHSSLTFLGYGDEYYYWGTIQLVDAEAALLTFDSYTGRTDRTNALKWINFNLALGGPLGNLYSCVDYCGFDNNIANPAWSNQAQMDLFIALPAADPVGGVLPSDPRPSLPLDYYDGSFNQNGISRTSWTNGVLFSYWFNNSYINHEYNIDGRFDIFSNNEYITKGRVEFNNYDNYMSAPNSQNEMSLLNSTGTCGGTYPGGGTCSFREFLQFGGQIPQQQQAGMVTMAHAELPAYVAAHGDTTNAYNGEAANGSFSPYNDITAASRSFVYLKGSNQVVFYDRASVGHSASTQRLQQVVTGTPTISSNTASWLTRSATQKAYFTSLLPSGGTVSNLGLLCPGGADPECNPSWQAQDWEPAAVLQVTPPGTPTSTQFLSTLAWGSSSLASPNPTLVQSSGGQGFDGALIGSSLVMFERNWPAAFTSVTYPASGATTHYISDLTPNTTYTISGAGAPATATTDTAGVLTFSVAGTGDITIRSVARTTAKSGITAKAATLYAAGAVATAVVLASCVGRIRTSRTTRTILDQAKQPPENRPSGVFDSQEEPTRYLSLLNLFSAHLRT